MSTLHAVLEQVSGASTKAEKIEILKRYNCMGLRDVLKGGFDDTIEFDLPKGVPPFTTNTSNEGHTPTSLEHNSVKLAYCVKGHPKSAPLKAIVRERMFLEILEGIPKDEAELVIAMKEKKLGKRYKGLTKDVVMAAFPNLMDAKLQKSSTEKKEAEAPKKDASTPAPENVTA